MTAPTLTQTERKRQETHNRICRAYLDYSNKYPETAPHRIFLTIAEEFGMTIPGVRNIIIKAGLYTTK